MCHIKKKMPLSRTSHVLNTQQTFNIILLNILKFLDF